MILILGFSLLFFYKGTLCDKLIQNPLDQMVASGSETTLLYTYSTGYSDPDLYWYRKVPDEPLQFILFRDNSRSLDADFVQGRFSVQHSQIHKTFHLVISPLRTEDCGTYYCAL
ncbi:Ig heavy chain V-III region HIL, partial [Heterocephalus glaber]